MEDRAALRDIENDTWPDAFQKVGRLSSHLLRSLHPAVWPVAGLTCTHALCLLHSSLLTLTGCKYLEVLECPFAGKDWRSNHKHRHIVLDWLLGRAVALEFHDNGV